MLLFIPIILFAAGVVLFRISRYENAKTNWLVLSIASALILGVMLIALGIIYLGLPGDMAKDDQHFETLIAQYEAAMDDDVYTKAHYRLFQDIDKWNGDLAWNLENQHDFWIGPFVPDIYDKYEFITVNMFMKADYEEDEP